MIAQPQLIYPPGGKSVFEAFNAGDHPMDSLHDYAFYTHYVEQGFAFVNATGWIYLWENILLFKDVDTCLSDWGFDLVWCKALTFKFDRNACVVAKGFHVVHLDKKTLQTTDGGKPFRHVNHNGYRALDAYRDTYPDFYTEPNPWKLYPCMTIIKFDNLSYPNSR